MNPNCLNIQKFIHTYHLGHAMHIASLTMLRMGVGESNILTNAVYLQLIKNHPEFNFGLISLENVQNEKHFFILISEDLPRAQENLTSALLSLSEEAIVVDPFLNFTGPANHYTKACEDFLKYHVFEKITHVKPKMILSTEQFTMLENHADKVFQSLMDKGIPTFLSKEFLDLALTGYTFTTRKVRADAPLIDNLKTTTLPFFGLCEQETQQVDAIAEIKTAEEK
ncbi:MAG: hypothetical protein EBV05_09560, partial [Cyanobacteria bacterium WB6_1B_304]|nr:hypothetical protein [Cyanobacteria bacterium WB6_1B_304]